MSEVAILEIKGKKYEFPLLEGSENELAIDIATLRAQTGAITLDIGYKNTGSTKSSITFLDGEKGILRHRGYDINDLVENSTFLEVAYLLIYGELPNQEVFQGFTKDIKRHTLVHEDMKGILDGFPSFSHPMGMLSSLVSALTAFNPQERDHIKDGFYRTMVKLIGKLPTLAAWAHRKRIGRSFNFPKNELNYAENFLHMMFANPSEDYQINTAAARAIDKLLILHADHEQNCSASTVRIVGSAKANIYASIASGISALWGPLHGGANQAVIEMLENIKTSGKSISHFIEKAKDKNDPFRLMGFGHRVYKNFDPRSRIIKKYVDEVLNELGTSDPVLDMAKEIENIALADDYFVDRKLFPNVDFYSGILYRALNIPVEMFTVMFALGRLPGWIAQWKEMTDNKEPIGRPRQLYTGPTTRKYPNP